MVIKILGEIDVEVHFNKQTKTFCLLVIHKDGPTLLGQDWLKQVQLDCSQLHQVRSTFELQRIFDM